MKSFTVRTEGQREYADGKVSVEFTTRKPPKKSEKGGGSEVVPCAPTSCYDDSPSIFLTVPMTKEQASHYPIGHLCKVTIEPTDAVADAEEEDDGDHGAEKKPSKGDRIGKAIRDAVGAYGKA
jgi:hypothetical protein